MIYIKDLLKKPEMLIECSQKGEGHKLWVEILIFIGVFLVINIVQGIFGGIISTIYLLTSGNIGSLIGQDTNTTEGITASINEIIAGSDTFAIVMLFSTIIAIIGTIIYCRIIEKRPIKTMGFRKKNVLRDYLLGLVIGTVIFSVAVLLCIITGTADFVGLSTGFSTGIIVLFFLGYLVQGMSEEVLCRGYFMISSARKNSLWAAVIANSVIFALLHLSNPGIGLMPIINITLFGIFASVYMIKSGNIWGAAAIHSSWNFVQGNIFGIQVSGLGKQESILSVTLREGGSLINGGVFGLEGGLAVTVVLIVSTLVVLFYKSNKGNLTEELDG